MRRAGLDWGRGRMKGTTGEWSHDDRMVEPAADAVPSSALAAATRPMGPSPPTLVTNPLSSSIPVMLSFSVPSSSICHKAGFS